jgi:hypothetical protein
VSRTVVTILSALLALTACTADDAGGPSDPGVRESTAAPPEGGAADQPTQLEPEEELLDWAAAPGVVENTVTTNGSWFLTVEASGAAYRLDGPDQSFGTGSSDTHITNALLTEDWAVVVRRDRGRDAADTAEVTDLAAGEQFTVDGDSTVPTTSGGTWSLGGDRLVHATVTDDGAYCLATVDLPSREATVGWCAPPKQGFNAAHVTDDAVTVLAFDDAEPACRTVGNVVGTEFDAFPGVPECAAWEGAALAEGATVWSVIPRPSDLDAAEFFARLGEDYFALGPGTSGTLVPCGGAAYFVRDPRGAAEPAQLLRWDGRSLATVYEATSGQAFLDAPRCGDRALVLTAHAEGGDEQVMAALP